MSVHKKILIRLPLILAIAAVVLSGATANAQNDQVQTQSGDTVRGPIKKIGRNEIEIEERGAPRKIPRSQIKAIHFANEPRDLRSARDAAGDGKYNEALDTLAKVKPDDLSRDELKQELAYFTAYCKGKLALRGGDRAAADKELMDFVRANGESYHFYDAAELLGDLAYAVGNFEDAAKRYSALSKSEASDLQLRGSYLEGKSLLAKGDPAAAQASFEKVIADPLNDPFTARLKALCEVGKSRCLIEAGKPAEGIALAQGVIDRNDSKDSELFGAAYNALGAGYVKANQPKSAVIAFMHVSELFPTDVNAHAEALFNLEKLWTQQGKNDRAQECRNQLRDQYGGTIWATKG